MHCWFHSALWDVADQIISNNVCYMFVDVDSLAISWPNSITFILCGRNQIHILSVILHHLYHQTCYNHSIVLLSASTNWENVGIFHRYDSDVNLWLILGGK